MDARHRAWCGRSGNSLIAEALNLLISVIAHTQ